jgi:hypothetical protein
MSRMELHENFAHCLSPLEVLMNPRNHFEWIHAMYLNKYLVFPHGRKESFSHHISNSAPTCLIRALSPASSGIRLGTPKLLSMHSLVSHHFERDRIEISANS